MADRVTAFHAGDGEVSGAEHVTEDDIDLLARDALPRDERDRVALHLESCDECISRHGVHSLETMRERPKTPTPRPRVSKMQRGTTIGRYVVLEVLGRGGMGIVYSAYDPELDRRVAIKLLKARGRAQHDQAWLLREAQALARLAHPNVVAVHDVGQLAEDRVFIAMEHVEGETLREWMHGGRPWREVVPLMAAAGAGLAAAHAAGLVHRDFKPENVIVGVDGRARVMDFGLARLQDDAPIGRDSSELDLDAKMALNESLTVVGTVVGTPAYMAPELLVGKLAGPRSDQFAFGMTLFEALYKVRPYTPQQLELVEVDKVPVTKEVPRLGVPDHVHQVAMRAISIDPEARFPTMQDLLRELQPPVRKRRGLMLVSTAIGAAAAAGITFLAVGSPERESADPCSGGEARLVGVWDAAVKDRVSTAFLATKRNHARTTFAHVVETLDAYGENWLERRHQVCEATHVRHEQSQAAFDLRMQCLGDRLAVLRALTGLFANADRELVDTAIETTRKLQPLDDCLTQMIESRPPPTAAQAASLEPLDRDIAELKAAAMAHRYAPALARSASVVQRARQVDYAPTTVQALFQHALVLLGMSKDAEAERTLREALDVAAVARDDVMLATIWTYLIWAIRQQPGRYAEAIQLHSVARTAIKRAGLGGMLEGDLEYNIGTLHLQNGDPQRAKIALANALKLRTEALGARDPDTWALHDTLGHAQLKSGAVFDAKKSFETAAAIVEKTYGPNHPSMFYALQSLGGLAAAMGDYQGAFTFYQRALAITQEVDPTHQERVGVTLYGMAVAKNGLEDYAGAIPFYERALAVLDPKHAHYGLTLVGLADCREEVGDAKRAVVDGERGLELMANVTDKVQLAYAQYVLAKALWRANQDRPRARLLGIEARKGFVHGGIPALNGLLAVDNWFTKNGIKDRGQALLP